MPLTMEEAKALKVGDVLHHDTQKQSRNHPSRVRVSGHPKTWKRSPDRIEIPVKHGIYTGFRIDQDDLKHYTKTSW